MRLCFISDTHTYHKKIKIPECDILCHCGDFTAIGRHYEVKNFLTWFRKQPAHHLIYLAGNHDISYEKQPAFKNEMIKEYGEITYLENESITIKGIKIWGSPFTPHFNPKRWVFNLTRSSKELYKAWEAIPRDTDIVLTHGPCNKILDKCMNSYQGYPQEAGCELLRHRLEEIQPLLHVSGHVHEGRGMDYRTLNPTISINASICNLSYNPVNLPILLDLDIESRSIKFL